MTIHLSRDTEEAIRAAIRSGRFASADEMVASLVRDDASRHPSPPGGRPVAAGTASDLGSIGAMRDSAEELDEIVAEIYRQRAASAAFSSLEPPYPPSAKSRG